jgi:phospholipase/carboxylesterase
MLTKLVLPPRVPSARPPVLVVMHGLGADERDLLGLAPELDPRLMVVSLRAPRPYEYGGFAWFDIGWDEAGVHANEAMAVESRGLVGETLTALPNELGFEPEQLFVGGFSQGAMMSLGVASAIPEKFAGVLVLSGRLLPAIIPPMNDNAFARLPFLVQHGALDPVLPVSGAREIKKLLEERGCSVAYHEYPMGHEISARSLADASAWLTSRIS